MHRRHALSPGCFGQYQDLGISRFETNYSRLQLYSYLNLNLKKGSSLEYPFFGRTYGKAVAVGPSSDTITHLQHSARRAWPAAAHPAQGAVAGARRLV